MVKSSKSVTYELKSAKPQENVRIHHPVKGTPQLHVSTSTLPKHDVYELQLTVTEKLMQITETLDFQVRFDLVPRVTLVQQPAEVNYRLADEPMMIELPRYETYPAKNQQLDFKIEGASQLVSLKLLDEIGRLSVQVYSEDDSLVGQQTCRIIATHGQTGQTNSDAKLVINVLPLLVKVIEPLKTSSFTLDDEFLDDVKFR